jgi:hypothetical protein
MSDQPTKIRTLFCVSVRQTFFDLPWADIGEVWAAFGQMMAGIENMEGAEVLGTLDDDQTMVGAGSNGFPFTAYIMADMPDRDAVTAACNLFRTLPVGNSGFRLWKYCSVEARMGRALEIPALAT